MLRFFAAWGRERETEREREQDRESERERRFRVSGLERGLRVYGKTVRHVLEEGPR